MLGCIFERELEILPRRLNHFIARSIGASSILLLIITAWLLLNGVQPLSDVGDLATFGALAFPIVVPLATVVLIFTSAITSTLAIAHEKDRRTLDLLLISSLTDSEIVVGKLASGCLFGANVALPMIVAWSSLLLLGGISLEQVGCVAMLTVSSVFLASAWGTCVGFWREKTFQAVAICLLGIVLGVGLAEGIAQWMSRYTPAVSMLSPISSFHRCLLPLREPSGTSLTSSALACAGLIFVVGAACLFWTISRLRVWNPSRLAPKATQEDSAIASEEQPGTVPSNRGWRSRTSKQVWMNPILWRETQTWAYGRKILLIKIAYLFLVAFVGFGLWSLFESKAIFERSLLDKELVPASARWMGGLIVASLMIVNALAVNSIANERDGGTLELTLASQITSWQFLFGKIVGVATVAREMVLAPLFISMSLWWFGAMSGENTIFVVVSLMVLNLFATVLGIHCGMIYLRSRRAIGTSLGTLFFLFVGIVACMLIMISFRGSFERQLAPFLGIILGGGASLYFAIGSRNPSPAILIGSFSLPFLMFFALTSFMLRDQELTVFSVIVTAYGFTTLAMLVPALSEFEFQLGGEKTSKLDD